MFDSPAAPFSPELAPPSIEVAADCPSVLAETSAVPAVPGLVGSSASVDRLRRAIHAVRSVPRLPVLLTGESGSGKALAAAAVHAGQPADAPFIRVDCANLPAAEADAEALLFGVESACADAAPACCAQAAGGTLFLDEIGDLPPALQARLLRLLEEGFYLPLGATTPRTLEARVIAATHADLPARIAAGRFRQDLYYRLARFPIIVPPLRERLEDVPALVRHFLPALAAELRLPAPRVRPEALQRLLAHAYPGNVRELRHTLERALIQAAGAELGPEHIVFTPPAGAVWPPLGSDSIAPDGTADAGRVFLGELPLNLSEAEDILIARAVTVAEGNLSRAARLLGINRASLYRWQDRRAAALPRSA